uniref:DNA-directed RNA polymerase III subunit RPC3 n=1 Tax=Leersia perrieri TaxID=77586 RepID=A0A0D9V449_9ORYZ
MVSQHGILLAVSIISDHFGPLVSKVCGCLLRHGALPLQEIVRRLELSPGQVKNSLLVLIQHNCVQAFNSPRGSGDKTATHYLANFDNILHRQRFSKFLSVIRADIPESEALLEGLLQNGRLTFDQLVERTISKVPEGSITPSREEIRMNFNKLVFAHYVERCPKPEPFFDPLVDEQSTSTRKRAKTVEIALSIDKKVVNTASLSDAERFSEIPYIMEDASNANDSTHSSIAGTKRKHNALEVDAELNSTIAENEVLWRANFEKFIFCLKKKFCADRKKPKLKVGTHPIWEAFFEASLIERDNNSVTSPINGILERVGQKEGGTLMTLDHITRVLEELNCNPSSEDPDSFILDLSRIVEASQNEEIESLVKKKYGHAAFTIFRLLVRDGCPMETDKIIDTTILDKQIVYGTLYKLLKDDYIETERILSGTGTGNLQFFVWRVKNTFREQFIDNLYHAALNLRQMVNYIADLLLEGSKDDTKLRNRKNILILALTRHDDSLMLFNGF